MKYKKFLEDNYDILLTLFNHLDQGIWITDGDGVVLMMNDTSLENGGLGRKDLLGKSMTELVQSGYILHSAALRVIETGHSAQVIEELGEGGFCLSLSTPLRDEGKIDLILTIERDISEIVELQNALKEQQDTTERIRDQLKSADIDLQAASDDLVAVSYKMIRVRDLAIHLGAVDANVIILGESGAGKELIAELVYESSARREKPFVKVNCAAIPESLIESELFGYEAGSFTGAKSSGHKGMFESADGGTIFLDEIGELPLPMQSKLLRVLENGEIRRIGSAASRKVDVRVIAATNRDLKKEVAKGAFREDLYYRLMVLPIVIPPLRDRKEDIIPLAQTFLEKFNRKYYMKKELTEAACEKLAAYDWPGNVRELKNMMERLVLGQNQKIGGFQVDRCIRTAQDDGRRSLSYEAEGASLDEMVRNYERDIIENAIEQYGSISQAAQHLGVNKSTISRKLKAYRENRQA